MSSWLEITLSTELLFTVSTLEEWLIGNLRTCGQFRPKTYTYSVGSQTYWIFTSYQHWVKVGFHRGGIISMMAGPSPEQPFKRIEARFVNARYATLLSQVSMEDCCKEPLRIKRDRLAEKAHQAAFLIISCYQPDLGSYRDFESSVIAHDWSLEQLLAD